MAALSCGKWQEDRVQHKKVSVLLAFFVGVIWCRGWFGKTMYFEKLMLIMEER